MGDDGSAARFFYCAKASKKDRNEGLESFSDRRQDEDDYERAGTTNPRNRSQLLRKNHHPTVKPTELMRYLCRLVTPPNGVVLDPFMGSGSTGKAAIYEGFNFVGIEMTDEYIPIAKARIEFAVNEMADKLL
jgi:site-specific DNA-methyltransferase (adenine-specific)